MRLFRALLVADAACFPAAGPAAAQTNFGSITGTVTDPTGTSIPNARVEATHVQSGYRYSTQPNKAGIYTLAQLRDGAYTLRVQAAGFKEFVAQDIVLVSLEGRRIDVRLELGALESRIEVTAGAALVASRATPTRAPHHPQLRQDRGVRWVALQGQPPAAARLCGRGRGQAGGI